MVALYGESWSDKHQTDTEVNICDDDVTDTSAARHWNH